MNREALSKLSKDDLIELALAQAEVIGRRTPQVEMLTILVAELEMKLNDLPKMLGDSSLPLS